MFLCSKRNDNRLPAKHIPKKRLCFTLSFKTGLSRFSLIKQGLLNDAETLVIMNESYSSFSTFSRDTQVASMMKMKGKAAAMEMICRGFKPPAISNPTAMTD